MSFAKKLFKLLAPFHKAILILIGLLILYEGQQMLNSYFPSLYITLFQRSATFDEYALVFLLSTLNQGVFILFDNYLDFRIVMHHGYPTYKYLKTKALKKFMEMDLAWHQQNNSSVMISQTNRGVDKVTEILDLIYWEFIPTSIQGLWTIGALIYFNNLATVIVSFVALLLFVFITYRGQLFKSPLRKLRHDNYDDEWGLSGDLVHGVETFQMFGQVQNKMTEFENIHDRIIDYGRQEAKRSIYVDNRWRISVLTIASQLIWFIWIMQLNAGILTLPGLVYVSTLKERLFHSFWRFARLIEKAAEASESVDRYIALVSQEPTLPQTGKEFAVSGPVGIEIKDFTFTYPNYSDKKSNGALHHINLDIRPGHIVALVGPSGAGKTTIRRVVTGMWRGKGQILVGGHDVKKWSLKALLSLFAYVPQGDDVFMIDSLGSTIRANISLSRPSATQQEIEAAADLAGIHEFITSLPDKYDSIIGEKGVRLSGGQKQRVALARAILADRPILILDEATNALDALTEHEIQTKMRSILKGKTAIIIAHRLSTVWDLADHIVVMDQGQIVQEGTHEQLLEKGGLYASLVALQTNV